MKIQARLVAFPRINVILSIVFVFLLSGCAGPRIAEDLLVNTERLAAPKIENGYIINTEINPKIGNYEGIDTSVKQSLIIALKEANIFGGDKNRPYTISANIEIASQAAMSFGNFEGKLQVKYTVYDENNNRLLEKTIYTEAGSDQWFFVGAKRHRRARAVNIAKNVLEFTDYLKSQL